MSHADDVLLIAVALFQLLLGIYIGRERERGSRARRCRRALERAERQPAVPPVVAAKPAPEANPESVSGAGDHHNGKAQR